MNKETLRKIKFQATILARDYGILESHSNYCKFIILGKGRSGSNFLRGLLDDHSQVFTFGELFRDPQRIGWGRSDYRKYLHSSKLISLTQNDPNEFLENRVFRKFPKNISAVGFKIFYHHAQKDGREAVWTFLKDSKDIKVIHLKRENILKRLLSLRKAFITNSWKTGTPTFQSPETKILLTYEECLQEFIELKETQAKYDELFKDHPVLELVYEDLASDRNKEMKRVQAFLGIRAEPLQPSTYKQSHKPLSESISNYFELKEKFQGTPWETFFED